MIILGIRIISRNQNMRIILEYMRMCDFLQMSRQLYDQPSSIFILFFFFLYPFSSSTLFLSSRRQRYNEYVLCVKKNHGDEITCQVARQHAKSICPDEWVSLIYQLLEVLTGRDMAVVGKCFIRVLWN